MEEYHIGKEIEKEVRKQYPSIDAFAKALNRERQTVYDIFKRAHIATDRLMEISRLLNRDFFKEFSEICMKGTISTEEENTIKECIGMLMPEDELHVVKTSQVAEIADEYFLTPREKPLVVVCDRGLILEDDQTDKFYDGSNEIPGIFHQSCKDTLGKGMVKIVEIDKKDVQSLDCQIDSLAGLPQKVIEVCSDSLDYDKIISFAEKLTKASGKFVILYWNHINKLRWNEDSSTLVYNDLAEQCFNAWHERIHMFVAENKYNDYSRRLKLYQKSKSTPDDILFQAQELLNSGKKEEAKEMITEALEKKMYELHNRNSDEDIILRALYRKAFKKKNSFISCGREDKGNRIRWHVTNEEYSPEMKELLRYHLIEDIGFWFDKSKKDGKILDWRYENSYVIRKAWGIDNTYTLETNVKEPADMEGPILFVLNEFSSYNFKKKTLTIAVPAECVEAYQQYPTFVGKDVEFVAAKA